MKNIILSIALVMSSQIKAEEITPEDIDLNAKACVEDKFNTADIAYCMLEEMSDWDKLLNQSYKLIMAKLNDSEKEVFRNSQIAWIKYKDLEHKNIESILGNRSGTMFFLIEINSKADITKQRALQLIKYLEIMNNS